MKDRSGISPYKSSFVSNNSLEQENAILRAKGKKVSELQQKVELVLKHNSQLLLENQKLSKLLHQQKSDFQVMRNKYDILNSQRAGITSNQDYQIKKLATQNQHLKVELAQLQHLKNTQINDTRNQLHLQLQNLKRQHISNAQMYELEIRKLKDLLQRKQYEFEQMKNRVNRNFSETEYQTLKLKQQKQKLRNDLIQAQTEKKRQTQNLRNKLEVHYLTEIEGIKKNHLANLETIQFQNLRLKDSLSAKNQQIQSLLIKQQKLKQNFQETNNLLRNQNQSYRYKLIQFQRLGEEEFQNLKKKLQDLHQSEIQILKHNHQNYIVCLQQEMQKLEGMVNSKNVEIQQLIKQKGQTRQINQSQQTRLKMDIQSLQSQVAELEKALQNQYADLNKKLQQKQNHIQYLNEIHDNSSNKHGNQLESLKKLINHKEGQLNAKINQHKDVQMHLKESLNNMNKQNQQLRDQLQKIQALRNKQHQQLKDNYEFQINQLKEKLEGVASKSTFSKKQIDSMKQNIDLKDKESNLLKRRLQSLQESQKKNSKQIEDLKMKLLNKDRQNNKIVEEQRSRLEKSFSYQLESIRIDNENNIKSQKMKINQLQVQLKKKQSQVDELLKRYKRMEEGIFQLTQQQANKKQLTLKYPGATADLIATKNLFDVFIKSKILDLAKRQY